jgi:hypothetical protein
MVERLDAGNAIDLIDKQFVAISASRWPICWEELTGGIQN